MNSKQKIEQEKINKVILEIISRVNEEGMPIAVKRLRSCQAHVFETENFYVLESYYTNVACIEKSTGICYDFLRYIYGFTRTSAQHISKFWHDYSNKYPRFTYYEI